jgi:hypothetical protein
MELLKILRNKQITGTKMVIFGEEIRSIFIIFSIQEKYPILEEILMSWT